MGKITGEQEIQDKNKGKGIGDKGFWVWRGSRISEGFKSIASRVNVPQGLEEAVGNKRLRLSLGAGVLAALVLYNLVFYLPGRLEGMVGFNGMSQAAMQPFRQPRMQALAPALVIVTPKSWTAYGTLLDLEDPWLDTPIIFALSKGPAADAKLGQDYPERLIIPYAPGVR